MEVRTSRPRVNRAVAAVQLATAPVMSASPLVTVTGGAADRHKSHITRFSSFDALRHAQQKPDPHALLRKELEAKLPRSSPRNDVLAVGDAAVERVLEFLGPVSRSAVVFAQTCRSVRRALLRTLNLEVAVLTPTMVTASALSKEFVRRALTTFAAARSVQVRTLILHEDGLSAVRRESSDGAPFVPLTLPALWVLQLISQLPYLTELDVRHVQFAEAHHSQVLHYLLSDLHLAAASTLRTLKMDAELMRYWAPGWWRRLVNLTSLVVGSRYCPPVPILDTAASAIAPPSLVLPEDYFTLMCEEGRRWQLKLWVPLQAASLKQLIIPASGTIFAGVSELLVNMRHNERACDWANPAAGDAPPLLSAVTTTASEPPLETRNSAATCRAAAAGPESGEAFAYPALTTVTVVDVQERPEVAAEVYHALLSMAPTLVHFNVCDTVSAGTATEAPKKRQGMGVVRERAGEARVHSPLSR
ncbi:hypothetical protein LSCM4_04053 [Leishmania orientalis]|uniref:Uncharacterized protein n=1 Tax=Leishmania orientalis TaxID=2249476 RepID=A0A836KG38_9TRYP|nr:hypothetical protein LSCM4_04053 [Leishmania orientalis]